MEVFRLSKREWANELSGKGAAKYGARWNSSGTEIIYTALNRSLAMAEVAVHFSIACIPDDYVMITIFVPDDVTIRIVQEGDLPTDWNSFPYFSTTQNFGDEFIKENKFCLLKIPSSVTKGDYNILINPLHKDFKKIKILSIEPFPFDHRIFK
jgi:RES domain-containing protein